LNFLAKEFEDFLNHTGRAVLPWDWDYPKEMLSLSDPPFFITYVGNPVWTKQKGLAVVGARTPSIWTQNWLQANLKQVLKECSIFTVSGAARGVDQLAHLISIRELCPTVAVLPAGARECYPADFKNWYSAVVKSGGAIVSEFLPKQVMQKSHFGRRNRLIAAFSCLTLIVQARLRSGTLLTAKHAIEQGKPLGVLPSHPLDVGYTGSMQLLEEGASWVIGFDDVIAFLKSEGVHSRSAASNLPNPLVGSLEV
jgi:DNA processing protein